MGCHTWSNMIIKRPTITKSQYFKYYKDQLDESLDEIDKCSSYDEMNDKFLLINSCFYGYYDNVDKENIEGLKELAKKEWITWYSHCIKCWKIKYSEKIRDNGATIAEVQTYIDGIDVMDYDNKYVGVYRKKVYKFGRYGDGLGRIYGYPDRKPITSYKAFVRYYIKCWKYGRNDRESESLGWVEDKPTRGMFRLAKKLFKENKGRVFITFG